MTRKAQALGMTRTVYRNASGLPDDEQVTTARDLTILARAIQDRFPKYYRYFQTRVFHYAGASHANHNKLLGRIEGLDGIKTGFTRASGFNLLTNVRTEDRHIVAVVLGGRSGTSRDQIMASLVQSNLPRAYAGLRTAPAVVAESPQPQRAPELNVETTATTGSSAAATPEVPVPARRPLDLNSLRPVVASAAGASSTTTPVSPPMRWQTGPQALPQNVQAFAVVNNPEPVARPSPDQASQPAAAKVEDRLPAGRIVAAKAEMPEVKREAPQPIVSGWVIQLAATDDEGKARSILDSAKSRSGRVLSRASGFTEKVTRDGATLYRARFSGFSEADDAQQACKALKRTGFTCFATRG
jgi:D-alanyl-D-alanine carboxypeptidase